MAADEAQVVDPIELPVVSHYQFSGDNRTVQSKRAFLEWYRIKASIFHAAQAARIARSTVYKWIEQDSEFAQAVVDSFEDAADTIESSVYERAFKSDLLAMFWLKAHRPKFRDKVSIDIEGVKDEINQRIQELGLQLGPAMITTTLDSGDSADNTAKVPVFPPPSPSEQKE